MAEGGLLTWKVQKLKTRGPVVSYSKHALALPNPPEGKVWIQNDDTREWTLIDDEETTTTTTVVAPTMIAPTMETRNNDNDKDITTTKTTTTSLNDDKSTTNNNPPSPPPPPSSSSPRNNVDYIEHTTLPTDTLQGLCIAYKTTAQKIRQLNGFSGNNLLLAPQKLIIPSNRKELAKGPSSMTFKRRAFVEAVKGMGVKEANAYLDIAEGDLEQAINDALEDCEWERK